VEELIALVTFMLGVLSVALHFYVTKIADARAELKLKIHKETHCKDHITSGEKGFERIDRQLERIYDLIKDLSDKLYEMKR
jgi:hypothetical protein